MVIKILVAVFCFLEVAAEKRLFLLDEVQKQHCESCFDCKCNHNPHIDCNYAFGIDSCAFCPIDCQHGGATIAPTVSFKTSTCDKVGVIDALARNEAVSDPLAWPCGSDPAHKEWHALVLHFCNATVSPFQWKPGKKVINEGDEHCSTPEHSYIPIMYYGQFTVYTGVMIACNKDEIKIAYQDCTHSPQIVHFNKDSKDPSMYNIYVATVH